MALTVYLGQQVTGYPHADVNNHWQVIPTKALPETGRGRVVRHQDVIQLRHIKTNTLLLTHDVASPTMATNQEFTTIDAEKMKVESRYNDTLFHLNILKASDGQAWKSKAGHFRLVHVSTKVSLWTHKKALPEWAFNQQEINGNKNAEERTATWYVDDIVETAGRFSSPGVCRGIYEYGPTDGEDLFNRTGKVEPKKVKPMNFLRKFAELQTLMIQHNSGLTASHPYATNPINWPFLLSGISFWTQNETKRQIYMIGNVVGWWTCVISLSVFTGIVGADLLARRRGIQPIPECASFDSSPPMHSLTNPLHLQSFVTVSGTRPASSSSPGRSTTSLST